VASAKPVTVQYATANGPSTAGILTFDSGDASKIIRVLTSPYSL
jgi:hypothetical protein